MAYKTELQSNNTDLQSVLSKVNALPGGAALGDATAADVAQGKTFSSAVGLKVTGAAEIVNSKTGTFTVTSNKTDVTISELDFFPKYFLALDSNYTSTGDRLRMFEFTKLPDGTYMQVMVGANAEYLEKGGTMYSSLTTSGFKFVVRIGANMQNLRINSAYTWYAFG